MSGDNSLQIESSQLPASRPDLLPTAPPPPTQEPKVEAPVAPKSQEELSARAESKKVLEQLQGLLTEYQKLAAQAPETSLSDVKNRFNKTVAALYERGELSFLTHYEAQRTSGHSFPVKDLETFTNPPIDHEAVYLIQTGLLMGKRLEVQQAFERGGRTLSPQETELVEHKNQADVRRRLELIHLGTAAKLFEPETPLPDKVKAVFPEPKPLSQQPVTA